MVKKTTEKIEKVSDYVQKVNAENEKKKKIKIVSIIVGAVAAVGLGIFGITKLNSVGGNTHNISTATVYTCTISDIAKSNCAPSSGGTYTPVNYKNGSTVCSGTSMTETKTYTGTLNASTEGFPSTGTIGGISYSLSNCRVTNQTSTAKSISCTAKRTLQCLSYGICTYTNVSASSVSIYTSKGYSCGATSCAPGTYYSGQGKCLTCPAGSYCPGTTNNDLRDSSGTTPPKCDSGYYSNAGAISCTICPVGSYCVNGIKSTCPEGSDATTSGQTKCTECSFVLSGSSSINIGESTTLSVKLCGRSVDAKITPSDSSFVKVTSTAAGYATVTALKAGNVTMSANYTTKEGKKLSTTLRITIKDNVVGITCPAGEYYNGNLNKCDKCPSGSYCVGGTYKTNGTDQGKLACPTGYPHSDGGKANPTAGASSSSMCFLYTTASMYVATPRGGLVNCDKNGTCYEEKVYSGAVGGIKCKDGYELENGVCTVGAVKSLTLSYSELYLTPGGSAPYSAREVTATPKGVDGSTVAATISWDTVTGAAAVDSKSNVTSGKNIITNGSAIIKGVKGGTCSNTNNGSYIITATDAKGNKATATLNVHVYCSNWQKSTGTYSFTSQQKGRTNMLTSSGCEAFEDLDTALSVNGKYVYKTKYNRCCGCGSTGSTESDACYLNTYTVKVNNVDEQRTKFVWGKYAGKTGYTKQSATTEATCGACYTNGNKDTAKWFKVNDERIVNNYPNLISGVTTESACNMACYYKGTDYKWEVIQPSGYTKVSGITTKSACKAPDADACYLHNNEYVWGKYAGKDGYTKQNITTQDACGTCYTNGEIATWASKTPGSGYSPVNVNKNACVMACYYKGTDYVWSVTQPTGYTKASGITSKSACKAPEVEACYLHNGEYVWGKFAGQSGYAPQTDKNTSQLCGACYSNGTTSTWATKVPGTGYSIVTGVTDTNACNMACYTNGTDYKWETIQPTGYNKVNDVNKKDDCKAPEADACYIHNGEYVWGKFDGVEGYNLQKSIKKEELCKAPTPEMACYSNGTDYVWDTTAPSGYTKVTTVTTSADCVAPESPACYVYNDQYVWGKFAGQSGYVKQSITTEAACGACYSNGTTSTWATKTPGEGYNIIPGINKDKCAMACYTDGTNYTWVITVPSGYTKVDGVDEKDKCAPSVKPACYIDKSGKRVWGEYSTDSNYTLDKNVFVEVDCKNIVVPITDQDRSLLVVICSIVFACVGAGMYVMFKKQHK